SYVIENPERASMRADDEIVAVNGQVAHRGVRQVELQRLPAVAVVKRNENRAFRTGKKQAFALGIFAYGIARSSGRNAVGDFGPRLAEIARAVNVRAQVIETEAVDGGVRGAGVEMRSLDDGNLAPGLELGRGDVFPGFSSVLRNVNQTVIGAGPNCIRVLEGRRDGINHATMP